jgi:ABC-type lipoprotein release transport system permease subunit
MRQYLRLAWRNIWRNKRRTLLTMSSIALAVFLALLMRSLQIGMYASIIDNIVQSYTGSIQIHKQGYWEHREDINNTFEMNDSVSNSLTTTANIKAFAPRLESFALASNGELTKGIALIGIDVEKENYFTNIAKKVTSGRYLTKTDNGILVAGKLADFLKLKTGDTLILISQGFEGNSAAGKFPVRGILHFPSPDMDGRMIYMDLPRCQSFFSCTNRLTSMSINLNDSREINKTALEIKRKLNPQQYEVMRWDEMLVEIVQVVKSKNASSAFLLGILYLIVGFGIFGTVLMMTTERIKEFGVVVSIGMQKTKLAAIVAIEMIYIGILGILMGMAFATPILYYYNTYPIRLTGNLAKTMIDFGAEPIMRLAFQSDIYIAHSIVVMVIVGLSIIYPMRKVLKLNIIKALHSR